MHILHSNAHTALDVYVHIPQHSSFNIHCQTFLLEVIHLYTSGHHTALGVSVTVKVQKSLLQSCLCS